MAKKTHTTKDEAAATVPDQGPHPPPMPPEPQEPASMPTGSPIPPLESYINEHDETTRSLATVRLEGGGPGDGTYLVDHPVPPTIGHRAARYVISRTEPGVTVYIWVNP